LVTPEDAAVLVDGAEPIRIAVERHAKTRFLAADLLLKVAQVLRHGRVRVVVGERAVQFAEQLDDLMAEGPEQTWRDDRARSIARVDHHLELARRLAQA